MKRRIVISLGLVAFALVATSSIAAGPPPSQQLAQLRAKIQDLRNDKADLQDQIDALNQSNGDQADTIQRLRNHIANEPDPIDVITARGPDGLWQAMRAIWLAFPTQDPSQLCGYDRSYVPGDGDGLTLTSYSFYRWSGC